MNEEVFEPSVMNENIEKLQDRLLDYLESSDLHKIHNQFAAFDAPSLIMGSGGSSVSSKFIANLINLKNGCISESKLPDEILHMNLKPYKNIVAISYSGINHGIKMASKYAENFGIKTTMITSDKKADKDNNIVYEHKLPSENSFISFANTLAPMTLALSYYIGDKEKTKLLIKDMFNKINDMSILPKQGDVYEVIGKDAYPTAAAYFESALEESSIAIPITSGKYDECHGRSTSIIQQNNRQVLYFMDNPSELDEFWHERLQDNNAGERITDIIADYNDIVINDFFLTLYMTKWCSELAKSRNIDLSTLCNKNGERLHILADPRAIKVWEEKNDKDFWTNKTDFVGLTQIDKNRPEKSPGYYAPTGKFFQGDLGNPGIEPKKNDRTFER